MRKEADSHSPSRVFRDEVGKFLPLGVAVGIRRHTGEVEDASREMSQASVRATAQALDIHSPSGVYRDAIGKNIPAGIAKGVREAQSELNAEMKSTVNTALNAARTASAKGSYAEIGSNLISGLSEALNTAKSRSSETVQEIIDSQYNKVTTQHEKKEQALQNKISKLGSKKENKRKKAKLKKDLQKLKARNKKEEEQLKIAGEKAAAAYNTAFEKEADRLTQIAQEKIQELSEEYQEQYSEIKSQMDSLTDKQQSWGNIYDLDQNIYDLEKYQKNLKSLENKIPESMMEKILGMDVDAATDYTEWFRAMSAEEQKAYINKWNTQQNMSKSFSSSFFADDFAKIQREYQSKLKSATDSLEKEMKKAGQNIAKGLTAGMQSETRNMSRAMKKICDNLIKTAKKKLKINSPSKEFEEIGKYNIQGAEKGHGKEAPKLYRQMESVSGTMVERFAKARFNVQEIQARMQTAVDRQMEAITTRVQPVLSKQTTTPVPEILYVGPEKIEVVSMLDGRELARETVQYIDKGLSAIAARKTRGGV